MKWTAGMTEEQVERVRYLESELSWSRRMAKEFEKMGSYYKEKAAKKREGVLQRKYCQGCIFQTRNDHGTFCDVVDVKLETDGIDYVRPSACMWHEAKFTGEDDALLEKLREAKND